MCMQSVGKRPAISEREADSQTSQGCKLFAVSNFFCAPSIQSNIVHAASYNELSLSFVMPFERVAVVLLSWAAAQCWATVRTTRPPLFRKTLPASHSHLLHSSKSKPDVKLGDWLRRMAVDRSHRLARQPRCSRVSTTPTSS